MPEVILICGRLCSGKTTYARRLCKERGAVLLSIDEITLSLFGQDAGEMHDTYCRRAKDYLFAKSLEILSAGVSVVLDWGFWTRKDRDAAKAFFASRQIPAEMHGIRIDEAEWRRCVAARNSAVKAGSASDYYVDEGLSRKAAMRFEEPSEEEISLWVES